VKVKYSVAAGPVAPTATVPKFTPCLWISFTALLPASAT
jgi:hypothetical protein